MLSCGELRDGSHLGRWRVDSIEIKNFRGFDRLSVNGLARANFIVGDNGVGKTAFLEAIYLLLSGHARSPIILKQWRGINFSFNSGAPESAAEAIYGDLFRDPDSREPISITATGRGFENRRLIIEKTRGDITVPVSGPANRQQRRSQSRKQRQHLRIEEAVYAPISLTWTNQSGESHVAHLVLKPNEMGFEGTGEDLPTCFMHAAQVAVPAQEAADHFSRLKKRRDVNKFREVFCSVFSEVEELSVETDAGVPQLVADVPWAKRLLPLSALSGGSSRAASILLSLAFREDGLVMVDEVESGIYHARQSNFARALLDLSKAYNTQMIITTHSDEWLNNVLNCVSDEEDNVAFWRFERSIDNEPRLVRFSVAEFRSGMSMGEMR